MSRAVTAIVCGEKRVAPPGDYFVTCSFDPNHVLLRSRMPYHIIKCVKQHPGHNKVQCPFDSTEYIDPEKFHTHLEECESRVSMAEEKYELARLKEEGKVYGFKQTPFFHEFFPETDEDWGGRISPESEQENLSEGVGRAVGRGKKRPQQLKKTGLGRAALLARFMKQYEEQQKQVGSSQSSSSSDKVHSLQERIVEGQFDDK